MNLRRILPIVLVLSLAARAAPAGPTSVWITSAIHDCAFATDDTVRVEVMFNSINAPIDQAGLNVTFDLLSLGFIRAQRGSLTTTWSTFNAVLNGSQVTVSGSNASAIPAGISGSFAQLVFVVKSCAFSGTVSLFPLSLTGDIAGAPTSSGTVSIVAATPGNVTVESISHSCGSQAGDTVEVDVRIESASQPVDAAGVEISFDPAVMEYVGHKRGDLTAAWPFFDAAQVVDVIRVGGFTTTPIPGGSSGVFVTLRFVVNCCEGYINEQLCSGALVDDFATMGAACGQLTCVPLGTRASTWGYVKSIYR